MKDNIIQSKSFSFAIEVVRFCKVLSEQEKEYILSKQLMRSGTAVGALIEEATQAESKADFIHKLSIANKEAHETRYWLRILHETHRTLTKEITTLLEQCTELIRLLVSIIQATKNNQVKH